MTLYAETGKHVKVVFKNGTVIEGIVEDWVANHVQLRSLNDESIMIIAHPDDDIMLIKILPEKLVEKSNEQPDVAQDTIREKLKEVQDYLQSDDQLELQKKSMVELKQMVVDQDRKMIQRKIRDHFPSAYTPHKPNYATQIDMLPPSVGRKRNG